MTTTEQAAEKLTVPVIDGEGGRCGEVTIEREALGGEVRRDLLRQVLIAYEAAGRAGTASTKDLSEVAGSGAKMRMQKGSGRARTGERSNPIWRGGGVVFGPKPRSYRQKITKRMRLRALASSLLAKISDDEVAIVECDEPEKPSTKSVAGLLDAIAQGGRTLLVMDGEKNLHLSARNIRGVTVAEARDLNALDVMRGGRVVATRPGFETLLSRLGVSL